MNPIRPILNFMKETPSESIYFKVICLIPVVGLIVQLWKDSIMRQELKAIKLDEVDIASNEGKERYNCSIQKVIEIINLSSFSVTAGRFVDIAMIIAGLIVSRSNPRLGSAFFFYGFFSWITRQIIHLSDWSLDSEISKKRPQNAGLDYAFVMMK
jgi:hypothetical protein